MRAPVFIDSSASFRVNPSCQIPPRRQCVLGNRWFLWLSKAQYPDMRLRSPSWALIDRRGYQPWLRREDPSLLWRFEAGAGVRSQNAEDHDGGFCFLPCGLVEPPSWDRRAMRAEIPVHSHRFACLASLCLIVAIFATVLCDHIV